jgi:membrane fusion protein, multidrug efflux system
MRHVNIRRSPRHLFSAVCILSLTIAAGGCGKNEQTKPPVLSAEVVAVTVEPKTIPVTAPFVAQTQSSHQVDVMARVNGFLEKICYKEGDSVREGQILFQIDRKPFQAQVDSVRAEVESRKAQLWTAKANLDRIKPLAEQNAVSKSDLDNAIGNYQAAEAGMAEAKARLQKAELDLGYTTIKSPVTGISGQSLMREGAYVAAGGPSAKLTYVAKLDPMWVDFSISQNESAKMRSDISKGLMTRPKNNAYSMTLELSDGSVYQQTGKLNFADPSLSRETGTYLVRGEISNPKGVLRPGMFVKAIVKGLERPNAIQIPQKAVQQTPNGHVVYVASDKGVAELRPVVVGEWIGQDWIINSGLHSGDRVIVEGFQRLAPGTPVKVVLPGSLSVTEAGKAGQAAKPAKK